MDSPKASRHLQSIQEIRMDIETKRAIMAQNLRAYRYSQLVNRLWEKLHQETICLIQEGWRVQAINARTRKLRIALEKAQARAHHNNRITSVMIIYEDGKNGKD
jgi:hypothetical protein